MIDFSKCPLCGGPLASDGVCADDECGADDCTDDECCDDRCQPIGCDAGYHLPGCTYLERDASVDDVRELT